MSGIPESCKLKPWRVASLSCLEGCLVLCSGGWEQGLGLRKLQLIDFSNYPLDSDFHF